MAFAKNRLQEGVHTSGLPAVERTNRKHLPATHQFPFPTSAALYIDGELIDSASDEFFPVFNPCTEEEIRDVPRASPDDIEYAIIAAKRAHSESWERLSYVKRAKYLLKIADIIESQTDLFVYLEGVDVGATVANATADVRACCSIIRSFASTAYSSLLAASQSMHHYESCGVITILLPNCNPLSNIARSVAPALLYGNTVIAIIEDDAPLTTLQLASVFVQSHLPKGVVNIVTGAKAVKESHVMVHKDISKAIIVGEACTGDNVLAVLPLGISQTMCIRKVTGFNKLEVIPMGRSLAPVPAIVSSHVDVNTVADTIVNAIAIHSFAVKAKWILVHSNIYDSFVMAVVKR